MTVPGDGLRVCERPPAPCRLYGRAKRRSIGRPDLIIGPSQHVIDVHRKHGFFEDVTSVKIEHGVQECADSVPQDTSESILYVGKHLRAKGLETLFSAARITPEITYHLCGTGPYDERSQEVASTLDNVNYHGFVSDERLREFRRQVTAAVVPSIWMENSPLTIYESFAQGLPVIGSDIGGIPELVNNERGRLFSPGDANELAEHAAELVTDIDLRRLRENALNWAGKHTIEQHVDALVDCYDS